MLTKIEEFLVTPFSGQMMDDFQRPAAHERVVAEHVGLQPFAGDMAVRKDFLPHNLVDGRVFIDEKADQRRSLTLGQSFRQFLADERLHIL